MQGGNHLENLGATVLIWWVESAPNGWVGLIGLMFLKD